MFLKRVQDEIIVSSDGETESFRFGATELADIVYACAWPGESTLLLTAARTEKDKADVMGGSRGNYRAYAASPKGLERLTDEYTNNAIPLPNQSGVAFSNGGSLVILSHGQRRVHKVGRFNWGPVSLSCNESGSRIALTKWKGDDRKLAFTDLSSTELIVSRFSYYSYLLMGDDILYVLASDVMCHNPATGKSRSLTPRSVMCELLDLVGVGAVRLPELEVRFASLTLFNGAVAATASVQVLGTWERLWHGVIRLPYTTHSLEILLPIERPWGVSHVASSGDTLAVTLGRHENTRLVEQRLIAKGAKEKSIAASWWPASHPCVPSLGFQFMP